MADLGFDVAAFMALSPEERFRICVKLATRAQALAAAAPDAQKRYYLVIAQNWLLLAEEMQRVSPSTD